MSTFDVNAILSSTAYGSDGDKIGKVEQVFLDDNSGEPTFLTVNTGLFGAKENFVPVKGARQDGDRVVLPYTKDVIKDAPKVDADQHLSPAEEEELYRYYEMNYDDGRATGTDRDRNAAAAGTAGVAGAAAGDRHANADRDVADRDRLAADRDRDLTDRDRAGVDQDRHVAAGENASVTRHEERLNVGTQEREAGHARLRKYVVTDHETVDVPVEREEVTVERTPLNGTEAHAGTGRIGEEEVDVTLHEERPVVEKEAVAVEEVGLNKQTVRETQRVEADVQKEQVDVETDVDRDGLGRDDLGRNGEAPRR
ncbi:PRC and DUF2382 domain-containing protein [Kocuria rhizophila]|uniref:PRC and DUF2382 domain-containing protein n=1 Tax=Kocuria TaxID=57493 RepID=UPI0021A7F9F0|nr:MULTISPECIES: PRC and DUF2382 domain-containing protein [Kocuria]MCT1916433.1 PRC and DUF2382 domain-containing protein [Kocuria rhizophila]MDN3461641.1 PRC and DUF2382 domain-containing protein [Kocuria sp. APC 4018]WSQ05268.1 PRC and DUF2382 domain-containing protein [Kocuria rhizophila]